MAESTLSIGYDEVRSVLANYLGYGVDQGNWTAAQIAELLTLMNSGVSQFLYPPPLPGRPTAHEWRFLKPVDTIIVWATTTGTPDDLTHAAGETTVTMTAATFHPTMAGKSMVFDTSGNSYVIASYTSTTEVDLTGDASAETGAFTITADGNYDLPDLCGGIDGDLTFGESEGYVAIPVVGEAQIRTKRQAAIGATRPRYGAVRPKSMTGESGQRFELMLWPTPGGEYNLTFRYRFLSYRLTATFVNMVGGMPHCETILQSCLALAEHRVNDEKGIHWDRFMERLAASIEYDQRQQPEFLGYNADSSSEDDMRLARASATTYNGTLYEGA